jgi:hypothetical protein
MLLGVKLGEMTPQNRFLIAVARLPHNIGSDEFYRVAPVADLEKMRDDELRKKGIYTIMKEQLEK